MKYNGKKLEIELTKFFLRKENVSFFSQKELIDNMLFVLNNIKNNKRFLNDDLEFFNLLSKDEKINSEDKLVIYFLKENIKEFNIYVEEILKLLFNNSLKNSNMNDSELIDILNVKVLKSLNIDIFRFLKELKEFHLKNKKYDRYNIYFLKTFIFDVIIDDIIKYNKRYEDFPEELESLLVNILMLNDIDVENIFSLEIVTCEKLFTKEGDVILY
jgi:hypothetical protein